MGMGVEPEPLQPLSVSLLMAMQDQMNWLFYKMGDEEEVARPADC